MGQGRSQAIIPYNQVLNYLEKENQDESLYKFRAITAHHGPLKKHDPNYNDYNKLRCYFGWVDADTLKKAFENSTQWARL